MGGEVSHNLFIIKDDARAWFHLRSALRNNGGQFGEQSRFARSLSPTLSQRERGRCQPSLGLNPILPKTARATIKRYLTVRFLRRLNPFQKDVRMINEHIQNFFEEGELSPESVIRKFRITAADGKTYDAQPQRIDAEFEQAERN